MQFSLDKVFGVYQHTLRLHERRAEVLASNLANTDTPGFKARDIDFRAALKQVSPKSNDGHLTTTNAAHMNLSGITETRINQVLGELKYRVPSQGSFDGNTVDPLTEKSAFMENALMYQTSLEFLTGKIKSIKTALSGE